MFSFENKPSILESISRSKVRPFGLKVTEIFLLEPRDYTIRGGGMRAGYLVYNEREPPAE